MRSMFEMGGQARYKYREVTGIVCSRVTSGSIVVLPSDSYKRILYGVSGAIYNETVLAAMLNFVSGKRH